jgi:hypothetical protein
MPIRLYATETPDDLAFFANNRRKVTVAVVADGGTDYEVGDQLTVIGGVCDPAVLQVASAPGGVIASVTIHDSGAYTTVPGNPVSVTGGSGSGATFNLTSVADAVINSKISSIEHRGGIWYLKYWVT